ADPSTAGVHDGGRKGYVAFLEEVRVEEMVVEDGKGRAAEDAGDDAPVGCGEFLLPPGGSDVGLEVVDVGELVVVQDPGDFDGAWAQLRFVDVGGQDGEGQGGVVGEGGAAGAGRDERQGVAGDRHLDRERTLFPEPVVGNEAEDIEGGVEHDAAVVRVEGVGG